VRQHHVERGAAELGPEHGVDDAERARLEAADGLLELAQLPIGSEGVNHALVTLATISPVAVA
jgi:hypothetical protein